MEEAGTTFEELSNKLDIETYELNRWKKGIDFPSNESLEKLCSILNITEDEIIESRQEWKKTLKIFVSILRK